LQNAAAVGHGASTANPDVSPTITLQSTTAGIVIVTAGYMSPDQARGKAVDKRSVIWAFGLVLAEMLTGRSLFAGETLSDTLAAVLRSDIDYSHVPTNTHPGVLYLIERCLEHDRVRRLRDIGEAGIRMDAAPVFADAAAPAKSRRNWPWTAGLPLVLPWLSASHGFCGRFTLPNQRDSTSFRPEGAIAW